MLDVAFAAGGQWRSKTQVFLDAIGERLVRYVDHHEHRDAWAHHALDPRFLLVPNRIAHACPELVTEALCAAAGPIDDVVAHCDFDGAISAVKWLRGGTPPWPEADEDARAVDSPGRGHVLSTVGERIAYAMDEASVKYERNREGEFMTRVVRALARADIDLALDDEIDSLAAAARSAEAEGRAMGARLGSAEGADVFVVRVPTKVDNRTRRNLLLYAEEHARIGALYEPDPQGGAWLTAATFDEAIDLERVEGFDGGRSDYRFARAHKGGHDLVAALNAYATATPRR